MEEAAQKQKADKQPGVAFGCMQLHASISSAQVLSDPHSYRLLCRTED
jgi:hypothetical protein